MVLRPLSLSASMMRLKPSVCSRSASATFASMLCTAADIPLLPGRFSYGRVFRLLKSTERKACGDQNASCDQNSPLKQFLSMRLDIGGKTERVIAGALLRKLGIARLEGFDDGHVLGQRSRGALDAPDRQLAVAANMQQDVVGHVDQHR